MLCAFRRIRLWTECNQYQPEPQDFYDAAIDGNFNTSLDYKIPNGLTLLPERLGRVVSAASQNMDSRSRCSRGISLLYAPILINGVGIGSLPPAVTSSLISKRCLNYST